ncbi:hypothetical protein E3N88_28058 [Mikania micrantha]|uniref:Uncharacterized protein n=1 Tax=Mikania micrantha TaxID=192012 RepID=A0A5N6MZL7_9ASTR|nr:hypothetical protein E3N88_28058 [Mikania micrantha]
MGEVRQWSRKVRQVVAWEGFVDGDMKVRLRSRGSAGLTFVSAWFDRLIVIRSSLAYRGLKGKVGNRLMCA